MHPDGGLVKSFRGVRTLGTRGVNLKKHESKRRLQSKKWSHLLQNSPGVLRKPPFRKSDINVLVAAQEMDVATEQ